MKRVSTTTDLHLSQREKFIARLIAWGFIQKEIADNLHISVQTVSVHLRNIYRKLHIRKETDLTRWFIFTEYGIADNPFKKIVVVFFLVLTCTAILTENSLVRTFSSRKAPAARVSRVIRVRRNERVLRINLALTA